MESILFKVGVVLVGVILLVVWMTLCKPDWFDEDDRE